MERFTRGEIDMFTNINIPKWAGLMLDEQPKGGFVIVNLDHVVVVNGFYNTVTLSNDETYKVTKETINALVKGLGFKMVTEKKEDDE
jgi:hypothetical protein